MSSHQSLAGERRPLLEPLGQVSWGQLSVSEAWVFPEPKYLPSINHQEALAVLFDPGGDLEL